MKSRPPWHVKSKFTILLTALIVGSTACIAAAVPLPGGTVDPLTIPKYVTPLVIPPVMPASVASPAPAANYDIAVRQFKQQILPGGIWNTLNGRTDTFPATTVWSYGRAADPLPDSSAVAGGAVGVAPAPMTQSSFNYPAFTVENTSGVQTTVRWINDLVDPVTGNFLPHLLPVDQTLHWANPTGTGCVMPMTVNGTDCRTLNPAPYAGPVPIVTHVHGAHVGGESDGGPETWWLPGPAGTKGIPAGYVERGSNFSQADPTNTVPGSAWFRYPNTQPAATIWYHDHALGMTRTNVVAGPAGFWLIRGGANDLTTGLPGPAPTIAGGDPNFTTASRNAIREIPIAIQDRAFDWADAAGNVLPSATGATQAKLFYPATRAFFDGFLGPYIGNVGTPTGPSDIAPIHNPEVFLNTIVVNGTSWPKFDVKNAKYRFRLLNGCTSRTLNLVMYQMTAGLDGVFGTADDVQGAEVPFYQIGGDQGFLPKVVKITKGFTVTYPGNGTIPAAVAAPSIDQALLLMPAERADVIVDFAGLANGTHVRIVNTGPDMPFGGFPVVPADPLTSGQVMEFVVNTAIPAVTSDTAALAPQNLVLPAEAALGASTVTRKVSLNEMESSQVCVELDPATGTIIRTIFSVPPGDPTFAATCAASPVAAGNVAVPEAPKEALLGTVSADGLTAIPKIWADPISEKPVLNTTETWELFNMTADAHPIHLHLVRFQVVNRQNLLVGTLTPDPASPPTLPEPNEAGYKDTAVMYPGQVTRIKATFDKSGLYVWHCHIVEHEDNEMMRPLLVPAKAKIGVFKNAHWFTDVNGNNAWDGAATDKYSLFGNSTWLPVSGDWSDTGARGSVGVFDPAAAAWYLDVNRNGVWDGATIDRFIQFGAAGQKPVTGKWSGSGYTKIGTYDPVTFQWLLDYNGNGVWDGGMDKVYTFGVAGAIPVTGDWNGDGRTKIGYFNPTNMVWTLDYDGDGTFNPLFDREYAFGFAGVTPVAGDWDGTGYDKVGVYDNTGAAWYLDKTGNGVWDGAVTDTYTKFGLGNSLPVVGTW